MRACAYVRARVRTFNCCTADNSRVRGRVRAMRASMRACVPARVHACLRAFVPITEFHDR